MGVTRIRPSRIIKEASFAVADLPDAAQESTTVEISGLPTRGIIRNCTVFFRDNAALNSTEDWAGILHTEGLAPAAAAGPSTAGLTTLSHITSALLITKLDVKSLGGMIQIGTVSGVAQFAGIYSLLNNIASYESQGMKSVSYDVSGTVLGPDANDGKLYFSIVSDGTFEFDTLLEAKVRLEIEPCY